MTKPTSPRNAARPAAVAEALRLTRDALLTFREHSMAWGGREENALNAANAALASPAAGAAEPVPSEAQKAVAKIYTTIYGDAAVEWFVKPRELAPDALLYTHPAASTSAAPEFERCPCGTFGRWAKVELAPGQTQPTNAAQVLTEAQVFELRGRTTAFEANPHAHVTQFATAIQRAFAEKNGLRLADGEANHG